MKLLKGLGRRGALFCLLMTTMAVTPSYALARHKTPLGQKRWETVTLTAQPGTVADHAARMLSQTELSDAAAHHDQPIVLVAERALSPAGRHKGLFVQRQSARLCGSAGCSTTVYVKRNGQWVSILEAITGKITLLPQSHKGFYDLLTEHSDRWVWNGLRYQERVASHAARHRNATQAVSKRASEGIRG